MKKVNEKQTKKVFWEYITTEANGDVVIKIKSKKAQEELRALVEKANKKLQAELEAKKKRIEAVTLEEAEEFDNLIAELVNSDAVYVKAGKMTGRNLQIDWDKVDGKKNSTGTKQGTKQKKQLEAIRVDAQFEF